MVRCRAGVAAPGSLTARYETLAGDESTRLELYVARLRLGYGIDEWRALPWWQRRVYVEGMQTEAAQIEAASHGGAGDGGGDSPMTDPAMALLGGTMGDLGALGFDVQS